MMARWIAFVGVVSLSVGLWADVATAELKTWDGKHLIDQIDVSLVYFVPKDGTPLPDWKERVGYFQRRIEQFHAREFQGQSRLSAKVVAEPFRSDRSTEQLRDGNADFIFFQTLREVDGRLNFGRGEKGGAFPILLVLSDINWRPLDDFYRLSPKGDAFEFEGQLINGRHHPGAASGGARATYLADRGVGWGLVSADGWRVPYLGSDCVAYHEGVGHPIGLPHPEPGNDSVMSLGQYRGWISESSLDDVQKKRLGWKAPEQPFDRSKDLFSTFRALPSPSIPKPNEEVLLTLDWPLGAKLKSLRVRLQTDVFGAWIESPVRSFESLPPSVSLGRFDRATPVSYRVDVALEDGQTSELWGYFQVRSEPGTNPRPIRVSDAAQRPTPTKTVPANEVDLLKLVDVKRDRVAGDWSLINGRLESPKEYGARIELPGPAPEEYRLTVIVEPLDPPQGLLLGSVCRGHRFAVLLNYAVDKKLLNALENVDGKNVGNATTIERSLFQQQRLSQVICTVKKNSVHVSVDGRDVIDWQGDAARLSLGDYWTTPHPTALFLGAYDCRYRFHRVTLEPLTGR